MKTSESIDKLATDLIAAQSQLTNPAKTKTNPHFKSSYVDLADGLDVVRAILSKNKIALVQGTSVIDGVIILNTRLIHATGQWIESDYPVSGFAKPQEMGSAMTYARRYSLFSLLGIAGEDDDDGNAAQAAEHKPVKAAKPAVVGLKPEDSLKVLNAFKAAMAIYEDEKLLVQFAQENKDEIGKLLPAHRSELQDYYKERKKELSDG